MIKFMALGLLAVGGIDLLLLYSPQTPYRALLVLSLLIVLSLLFILSGRMSKVCRMIQQHRPINCNLVALH